MRVPRSTSLVLIAVVLAGALASWAVAAGGGKTFADAVGDPGKVTGTGSDIATVKVTHDAKNLTFQVTTVKPLVELHSIYVVIDADRNAGTGDRVIDVVSRVGGFEWWLWFNNGAKVPTQSNIQTWDGNAWANRTVLGTAERRIAPATIELVVPRAGIGDPAGVDFIVRVVSVGTTYADRVDVDTAPDTGVWTYALADAKPLALGAARVAPARPRAGSTARVQAAVAGLEGAAKVRCSARLAGGATLAATGSLAGTTAVCRVKLPSGSRNGKVRGTLSVTAGGATASRPFGFTAG